MSALALDVYTAAYPSITNHIEMRIYLQSDPAAIVSALNYPAPHGLRTWAFPGLNRANYLFRIFEMSGTTIVQQLGYDMDVNPGSANGVAYRATEQVAVDQTLNFVSGLNTVTFDGTAGGPDWRGWDIATLDRIGQDSMRRGVDYSYDPVLAKITLLNTGDLFNPNEWFNVDFKVQVTDITASVPASYPPFSTPQIITANYSVNAGTDMGGVLIVDPSGNYLEIQLPLIATVPAGKLLTIEMRRSAIQKAAKIYTQTGEIIDWLAGSLQHLYICPQESISFYKFIDPSGPTSEWRVWNPQGNWIRLGEQVVDDNSPANVFNKHLFDGSSLDNQQYARIYNDYILQLPGSQLVSFDNWATGNNKYKFSRADSSIPANAGKFHLPDRRNMFERNTDGTRLPGDWQVDDLKPHRHTTHGNGPIAGAGSNWFLSVTATRRYSAGGGSDNLGGQLNSPDPNMQTGDTGGAETRPPNIAIRKYLLV